ncbi:MAG: hypothetical protein WAM82_35160, partial [Thermoanaerobaculia bacterium]
MKTQTGVPRLLLALALGALVFATGVILARQWLPDWQAQHLLPQSSFKQRFEELAGQAGVRLDPGAPTITFAKRDKKLDADESVLDGLPPEQAAEVGAGLIVDVRHGGTLGGGKGHRDLVVHFSSAGHPLLLQFGNKEEIVKSALRKEPPPPPDLTARFSSLLLRPGEKLGPPARGGVQGLEGETYPVQGSRPPQRIEAGALPGGTLLVIRQPVEPEEKSFHFTAGKIAEIIIVVVPFLAGIVTVTVLFFLLLGRRRIDLVSGIRLGVLLLVVAGVSVLAADPTWMGLLAVVGALFVALWVFVVWSSGESYLRSAQPGLTVSLDALLHGRLGPRGGRALVWG